MSMDRSTSRTTRQDLHDIQPSASEQRQASEHFDRSMVAQLGNVTQPEQLGSGGSQGLALAGQPAGAEQRAVGAGAERAS